MEQLKHECGIVMIRLLKPLSYYKEKYGTVLYGFNKLYLLMEKQHNRGQEGAGIGCVRLDAEPGTEFMYRERALGSNAISEIFETVRRGISESLMTGMTLDECPFVGELYMGHLRYSTTGRSGISFVHPFLRRNNWRSRNLMLCGNFNMTNVDEIFSHVIDEGQHPRLSSDMPILLEQLGKSLDSESHHLYEWFKGEGYRGVELTRKIEDHIDFKHVLTEPASRWDGGYTMCGMTGSGDLFVMRDPHGIRPAFYYCDDEIFVATSERPAIQTVMNATTDQVKELTPGAAVIVDKNGKIRFEQILPELEHKQCSFERIYFSRGGDADIYKERKQLGYNLVPKILEAVDYDLDNTIFSFIPNTAEVAFMGLREGLQDYLRRWQLEKIMTLDPGDPEYAQNIIHILDRRLRNEKVVLKDIKLRTFIAEGESRNELAAHVYDTTYGQVRPGIDRIVVIDDSIVRGTTLAQSIVRMLDRLNPKQIVVASSAPQVRYPDYYGIDMSRMAEFCAFRAAIELLRENGRQYIIDNVYRLSKEQENKPKQDIVNHVKKIYEPFTDFDISWKISQMLTQGAAKAPVTIVYQSVEGLRQACPNHTGDWYFSGDYPTPGGNAMINRAFINWYEGNPDKR